MDIRDMEEGGLYTLMKPCRLHVEPICVAKGDEVIVYDNEAVMFLGELGGEDLYGKPHYGRFLTSMGTGWIHKVAFK